MVKKKLNIWQKAGLQAKPRGRGRPPTEYKTKIEFMIPAGFGLGGKKKKENTFISKRKKKIGLATLEGGGAGFVIGGTLGGFGGMVLGFPIGVVAGNIYGKRKAGKIRGRPRKIIKKKR